MTSRSCCGGACCCRSSQAGRKARCACGNTPARTEAANPAALTPADIESVTGCDIFLKREGAQFRGGTQERKCLETDGSEKRWLDYRVVIGDGLFWYRKRHLTLPDDELAEEIAGFPHADLDEARLFSCGISWATSKDRGPRRPSTTSTCTIAAVARASARRMAASCSSSCTAATGRCRKGANRWC